MTASAKYHAKQLFTLSKSAIEECLERLVVQRGLHWGSSWVAARRMRVRALFVSAMTLNSTAIWTAKLVSRGFFAMETQRKFFLARIRKDPGEWGENAKSAFARALSGYSLGHDAVCIDRHLERMELAPEDAPAQWRAWFQLYESMYGPGETIACARWHVEILDWISGAGARPEAWK